MTPRALLGHVVFLVAALGFAWWQANKEETKEGGPTSTTLLDAKKGDVVKINDGVFRGYRGIVLREKGRERLLVELTLLRKAVAVEFARDALRRSR